MKIIVILLLLFPTLLHAQSGGWFILRSSDSGVTSLGFGGDVDDVPVPADYDGDGKADQAVYRNGNWYILQSANNQVRAVGFGEAGDIPIPYDFDNDGKVDISVYRDGGWFILQSSDGVVTSIGFGGLAEDIPVPRDYDGDGKADIAIYRGMSPATSTPAWAEATSPKYGKVFQYHNSQSPTVVGQLLDVGLDAFRLQCEKFWSTAQCDQVITRPRQISIGDDFLHASSASHTGLANGEASPPNWITVHLWGRYTTLDITQCVRSNTIMTTADMTALSSGNPYWLATYGPDMIFCSNDNIVLPALTHELCHDFGNSIGHMAGKQECEP